MAKAINLCTQTLNYKRLVYDNVLPLHCHNQLRNSHLSVDTVFFIKTDRGELEQLSYYSDGLRG
jgi:hypothetical protein